MLKVTSHEFQRRPGYYQDQAIKEKVTITHYGRDRLVIMDAEEYNELRKRARIVLSVDELSNSEINHIESTTMSEEHDHLNAEINEESQDS